MNLYHTSIVIVCLSLCVLCACRYDEHIQLIHFLVTNVTKYQPTTVVASVCWSEYWMSKLVKRLWISDIMCSAGRTSRATEGRARIGHDRVNVHDLNCPNALDSLREASAKKLLRSPLSWILLIDSTSRNTLYLNMMSEIEQLELLPDSRVLLAERIGDKQFVVSYVYKVNITSPLIRERYAIWRQGDVKQQYVAQLPPRFQRRSNLQRQPIIFNHIIIDSQDTKTHLGSMMYPEVDELSQSNYIISDLALEALNATHVVTFADSWGYDKPDGNWSGAVGHIQRGEAHLATPMFFIEKRLNTVEFIVSLIPTRVRFIFREPPLSYVSNIYALPLTIGVWTAIAMCVLTFSLALYVAAKWEEAVQINKIDPTRLGGSASDVFLLAISGICQQGCYLEPRRISGRISLLVLFTALMALYAAYSANVVVLLRSPSNNLRTLKDLLDSRMRLASSDDVYNKHFIPIQTEPIRKAIYEKKIAPPGSKANFMSRKEGIELLRKGLFAFNVEISPTYRTMQKTYLESEKCGLKEIDLLNFLEPWMPIKPHSPYRDIIKSKYHWVQEVGLVSRTLRRMQVSRPRCDLGMSAFVSVGMIDFYPALLWMFYGFCFAWLLLVVENIVHFSFTTWSLEASKNTTL